MMKKAPECVHLEGYNEETLLHQAVQGGHLETVKLILSSKTLDPAKINARLVIMTASDLLLQCITSNRGVGSIDLSVAGFSQPREILEREILKCESVHYRQYCLTLL